MTPERKQEIRTRAAVRRANWRVSYGSEFEYHAAMDNISDLLTALDEAEAELRLARELLRNQDLKLISAYLFPENASPRQLQALAVLRSSVEEPD